MSCNRSTCGGLSDQEGCGKGEGHPGRGAGVCRGAAWGASWWDGAGVWVWIMTVRQRSPSQRSIQGSLAPSGLACAGQASQERRELCDEARYAAPRARAARSF